MASISLNKLASANQSIEVKTAAGVALSIDGSGFLTSNINGSVAVTNADLSTIAGAIAGTEMQVDVLTMPSVVVTSTALDIRALASSSDSIEIKTAAGQALAMDGSGFITANINGNVATVPGGFATWKVSAAAPTTTESELVAVPLTGRLRILVQNLNGADVYLKEVTGVSTANGILVPEESSFEAELDSGANLFAISTGTSDLRIVEFAA